MPVLLPFPYLYLYRQRFDGFTRTGVVGLLNRQEARVLRHEETLPNRTDLHCEGGLWLWCDTKIPVPDCAHDHVLCPVTDGDRIRELQAAFEGKELFLADGHHRYAAGWNVAMIQTRSECLRSLPSHRLILERRDLKLPKTHAIGNIDEYLKLTPKQRWRAVVVTRGGDTRGIELSQDWPQSSFFRDAVVAPVRDAAEAMAAVESGDAEMAILVAAYTIDQIEDYARRGMLLPPKSTDFYPKLHLFQNESVTPATAHLLGVR